MSLLEQASLVITPNAYKESVLYSVVPNTTLGDMDVVRATTATRVNASGLIESVGVNIPRIDYTNGSCPSILVEPQRTNLALYSEQFDNVTWIKNNSTITANSIISPNGAQNADTVNVTSGTFAGLYQTGNLTSNIFTMSVFAKKGTKQWLYFINLTGTQGVVWFDLNNGTIGNVIDGTATIKDFGNGWYKCTYTNTSNILNTYLQLGLSEGNDSVTISSNGTAYIYGTQLEVGSYPTSYIPTVATSVTRNADVISKTGISSLIGQTEGTIFIDFVYTESDQNGLIPITISSNASNHTYMYIEDNNRINFDFIIAGSDVLSIQTAIGFAVKGTRYKIALAYKANNFAVYINGSLIGTQNSGAITGFNDFYFGYPFASGYSYPLKINSAQLYKTRLTNTELAQLTTI
jgi:hypothetical protein